MQKAAQSVALWNSPNRMQHPAVGWSRGQAGIGTADSAIAAIEPRLADAGIVRGPDGSWTITGRPTAASAAVPATSALRTRVSEISPATISTGSSRTAPGAGAVPVRPGGTGGPPVAPPTSDAAPTVPPAAAPTPSRPVPGTIGTGQTNASGADVIGTGQGPGVEPQNPATAGGVPSTPPPTQSRDTQPPGTRGANILPSPGLGAGSVPTDAMRAAVLPTNRSSGIWPTAPPNQLPQPTLEQVAQAQKEGRLDQATPSPSALMSATPQMYQSTGQVPGTLGTGQTDAGNADVIGTGQGQGDPNTPATAQGGAIPIPPVASQRPPRSPLQPRPRSLHRLLLRRRRPHRHHRRKPRHLRPDVPAPQPSRRGPTPARPRRHVPDSRRPSPPDFPSRSASKATSRRSGRPSRSACNPGWREPSHRRVRDRQRGRRSLASGIAFARWWPRVKASPRG